MDQNLFSVSDGPMMYKIKTQLEHCMCFKWLIKKLLQVWKEVCVSLEDRYYEDSWNFIKLNKIKELIRLSVRVYMDMVH